MEEFQDEVNAWLGDCFSSDIADNPRQRSQRFLEEALELFQAMDMTKEDALALVEYVFNRPKGVREQEIGGVMVTLAALCARCDLDMHWEAWTEIQRIQDPKIMAVIRKKQDAKNNALGISEIGIDVERKA